MDEPTGAPSPEDTHTEVTEPTHDVVDTGSENWEQRYKDVQSAYTKAAQSLKQAEPATQWWNGLQSEDTREEAISQLAEALGGPEQLLAALGYDVDGEELEDTTDEFRDPRVDKLLEAQEAEKAQRAQTEQLQAMEQFADAEFDAISKENSVQLDDDDKTALVALAIAAFPRGEDGNPQIREAHKLDERRWEKRQQKWLESKKSPHIPSSGVPGEKAPDLSDPEERRKVAERIFAAHTEQ